MRDASKIKVVLTKEEAKAKMLQAFNSKKVLGCNYFFDNGCRCAIGWLLPEDVARDLEMWSISFSNIGNLTYVLANELVYSGLLKVEGVTDKQLRDIQREVDRNAFNNAIQLIKEL